MLGCCRRCAARCLIRGHCYHCQCGYFCCCRVIVVSVSAATAGSSIAHGRLQLLTPQPLALSKLVLRLSCHRRCTALCLSRGHRCCYRCSEVVYALPPMPLLPFSQPLQILLLPRCSFIFGLLIFFGLRRLSSAQPPGRYVGEQKHT